MRRQRIVEQRRQQHRNRENLSASVEALPNRRRHLGNQNRYFEGGFINIEDLERIEEFTGGSSSDELV